MSIQTGVVVTLGLVLGFWGLMLFWESYTLVRRATDEPRFKTISMVLRDFRYRLMSLIYIWLSMPFHWWVPRPSVPPAWVQACFWILGLALVAWDIFLKDKPVETWPPWLKTARTPWVWMVVAGLSGYFLFPQTG